VRLESFDDVKNTSTDVLTDKLEKVTLVFGFNQINDHKRQAVICHCSIILQQNYLHRNDDQYIPKNWSCYGLPPPQYSRFFPVLFLQYTAHTSILDVLKHHNMVGYFEYVGGTLIVYDKRFAENKKFLQQFNNTRIYCTLTFTSGRKWVFLNSLDVTLKRMENHIDSWYSESHMSVWIFRKPHQRIDTHKTILTCCYSENHINVPIFRKPQWRIDILKTKLTYRYSETHSNISICRNPHSRITIQKATLTNRYSETHNNGLHHSKRFLPSSSSKIRCS